MIKRLLTLTLLILTGLVLMAILAHLALSHWQQGLAGQRLGQFAEVAEQIRSDVNRKLDHFLTIEQNRPYTDYLPVHVPFTNNLAQQTIPDRAFSLGGTPERGIGLWSLSTPRQWQHIDSQRRDPQPVWTERDECPDLV